VAGGDFLLSAHSSLSAFAGAVAGGLNVGYEWTFNTTFSERQSAAVVFPDSDGDGINDGQTVNFSQGAGATNYIEIYFDDTPDANANTGAGYDDGKLIMSGTIINITGTFASSNEAPNATTANTGVGITTDATGAANPSVSTAAGFDLNTGANGYNLLDNFGGDSLMGQQTVNGLGSTTLAVDVNFFDSEYFRSDIMGFLLDMVTNTFNNTPFTQTDPSTAFDTTAGTNGTDTAPALGTVNGLTALASGINFGNYGFTQGADIQFQTDATTSFNSTPIPEPGVLLMLGSGLAGLGFARRRKMRA
jgi:hypothetical protein